MNKLKYCVQTLSLTCAMCVLCAGTAFAAENSEFPLKSDNSDSVSINYVVNSNYEWNYNSSKSESGKNAYIAGNSSKSEVGISQIAFTVSEPGELSFDYEIGCYSSGKNYMMAYSINEEMTMENYDDIAVNKSDSKDFRGEIPWSNMKLSITPEMLKDGTATVYVAYVRNGTNAENGNYVALANVAFAAGGRDVNITANDGGSVSGHTGSEGVIGQEITLTANPDNGNRFYGWIYNGKFQHCEEKFTFNVEDTNKIEAVFASDGTYVARGGSKFYTADDGGIETALTEAQAGDTVMLLENATLSSDVTVGEGVTLYIPFDENIYYNEETGEAVGFINGIGKTIATAEQQYIQLTNPAGNTITVNGILRIGAVNSGGQGGYQGHISGSYGEIVNNGTITTKSGATLDVLGLITGEGEVNAKTGSSVYEGFIVADYSGGTNTIGLYGESQAPFQHYAMQNIQTKFTIGSGSTLYGYCSLVTGAETHNRTIAPIMSSDDACLFRFAEKGTSVTRTYSPDYVDKYDGLGRMTYEVTGGLTFQSLTLQILGVDVSTKGVSFPIPYTYKFNLNDGDYSVASIISLLPGAEVTVGEDANFTVPNVYRTVDEVNYLAALNVMDGLHQSDLSTRRYPYADELEQDGYPQSAMFVMNGNLKVEAQSGFCGLVQTNGKGSISIDENAILSMPKFQLGGLSGYDDNRTYMDLTARVNTQDGIEQLVVGKEYTAINGGNFIQPDYELLWMVNSSQDVFDCRDTNLEKYDVGYVSATPSESNIKYHILEKLSVTGEQAMTGTWSTETIMLGDVTGDKKINNQDLVALGQHILGTSLLIGDNLLAANVNSDDRCNNQDLVALGQYILGTIENFD